MAGSFLRQSTASQSRATPPFLDDTDFKTAETGLTIANTDVKIIINGGASADKNSGGGTHRANGVYGLTFDATDTATVGEMEVSIKVAGALPVFMKFWVLEEVVYDALFAASAAGYQVPIWSSASATVNLSNTTVKTLTDAVTLPTIPTNWITASGIATGAYTNVKFADSFYQDFAVDRGLSAVGSGSVINAITSTTASNVWSNGTRTLTAGTNIQLPSNGLANVTAWSVNIAGNLSGSVGSVTGNVGGNLNGNVVGEINTLSAGITTLDELFSSLGLIIESSSAVASAVWSAGTRTLTAIDEDSTTLDLDATIRSAIGMASANMDTQLGTLATASALSTVSTNLSSLITTVGVAGAGLTAADDAVIAAIGALNNLSSANVSTAVTTSLTTALTEGYRSNGATGSVRDMLYEIIAHMGNASIVSTTKTLKKIDGTTTAKTYTLDSATTPTSIDEAS